MLYSVNHIALTPYNAVFAYLRICVFAYLRICVFAYTYAYHFFLHSKEQRKLFFQKFIQIKFNLKFNLKFVIYTIYLSKNLDVV